MLDCPSSMSSLPTLWKRSYISLATISLPHLPRLLLPLPLTINGNYSVSANYNITSSIANKDSSKDGVCQLCFEIRISKRLTLKSRHYLHQIVELKSGQKSNHVD